MTKFINNPYSHRKNLHITDNQNPQTARIKTELESYLIEPKISRELDPLVYWKENGQKYPHLLPYASKYLCIPLSTASSEREFSVAGRIQKGNLTKL